MFLIYCGVFFFYRVLESESRFGVLEKPLHTQQKGTNEKNKLKREKKKKKTENRSLFLPSAKID